jgi:hypothetical protein
MTFNREKVVPPNEHVRLCGMHWLRAHRYGSADNGTELVALQWNPGSKTWTHSNSHDTKTEGIDTSGWDYISAIPWPEI